MRPAVGPRRAVTKLKCVVSLSGFDSRLRFRSHSVARHCARSRIARARLGAAAHLASRRGDPRSSRARPVAVRVAAVQPRAGSSRAGRGAPATNPRRGRDARAAWSASAESRPRGGHTTIDDDVHVHRRGARRLRGSSELRESDDPSAAVLTHGGCVWCTRTPIFHDRTWHCHVPTACGRPRSRITS